MVDGIVLLNEEYPTLSALIMSLSECIMPDSLYEVLADRFTVFGLPIPIALDGNKSVAASDSKK